MRGELMAKKTAVPKPVQKADPVVAATLAGIIYQAKLFNRQARINVPEENVVVEVIGLWRMVMDALRNESVSGIST
jgi:hypothetical protein